MRILVVGGTGFLGGATARAALDANHDVTVLSRGNSKVPAGAKSIIAERSGHLPNLAGFDAVIDTCAYRPDQVLHLLSSIGDAFYVMVSSISAYGDMSKPQFTEETETPLATKAQLAKAMAIKLEKGADAAAYGAAYGPLKASCEAAAIDHPSAMIRLGLIVGPGDYTDRFTWWVRRMDQGGVVPVPGPEDRQVQLIDVRDAATFLLQLAVEKHVGVFNVTGLTRPLPALLRGINPVAGVQLYPLERFTETGLSPWTDIPLVLPNKPAVSQMLNVNIDRALAAGLTFRPVEQTIADTLAWDRKRRDVTLTCGMTPEDEARVMAGA